MFEAAGAAGVRISLDTLRHTFAKQWLMNGCDAFSLQRILSHSTMDMVRDYVNLAQSDIQIQHQRYSPVDTLSNVIGAHGVREKIR